MQVYQRTFDSDRHDCPQCGRSVSRHSRRRRRIRDVKGFVDVRYGYYECNKCHKFFSHLRLRELSAYHATWTNAAVKRALALSCSGLTLEKAAEAFKKETKHYLSYRTLHDWKTRAQAREYEIQCLADKLGGLPA